MPVIDFTQAMANAKKASFEPLPPGEYNVTCIESTPTESSNGKPMIKTKWQVEDGLSIGKKVFNQFVFSADNDNALNFFFQHMKFLGLDEAFFAAQPSWEHVAATIQGRRCRMQLEIREWQGQPRNDVKKILPPMAPTNVGPSPVDMPAMSAPLPGAMAPVMPNVQVAPAPAPAPQVAAPVAAPAPAVPAPTMPAPAPVAPQPAPAPAPVDAPVAPMPQPAPAPVQPAPAPVAPVAPPVAQPVAPPQDAAPQYVQHAGFTVIEGQTPENI